jgi:ABC-type transport system substrate-binding protein
MKVNKVKSAILLGVMVSLFVVSSFAANPVKTDAVDPFFTLVFKTNGGGVRPDYGNFLRQHVARIGIDLNVIVQDWPTFVGELIAFRDFDICYVGLTGGGADPDFTGVYDENGSLNLFGYHTSMDYDEELGTGLNEWYMKQGTLIMPPDSEERVQHYWDWEQYMMDKICPLLPTFAPKAYIAEWSTLVGYNYTDGILQSFGKMYWSAAHTGQISTDELVITDAAWSDLNPLFQDDTSSSFISSATMDPLIWYDADLSVWPHLAESYTYINDTTIEIVARDGIEWGDDPDGLFPSEDFTIEDVYFTFYAWKYVSNDKHLWDWIKDMEIVGDDTLIIYVDGDDTTPENDPYAPGLPALSTRILPEHYLNQSQLADGVTPDINHPSWNTFATNCFGTGLFEISDFTEGVETVLTLNPDCWRLDEAVTGDTALNWVERFGFDATWDANGMNQLRIRIIPDLQTALLEFEAGKVDIEACTSFPDKRDAYVLDPNFNVQSDTTFSYGFYGYNMREVRPEMGDRTASDLDPTITKGLALRKAISYSVDRDEINDVIHRGEYTITDWPIYPKMGIWCNPNIIRYNHDLDKAREFMTKAGYDLGWTPETPGFTMIITISSLMAVAAAIIIKKRK